jgi:6-phosphogluconate dehydrogenase
MRIGIIGLGKLGLDLALRLKEQAVMPGLETEPLEIITWNRSPEKRAAATAAGLHVVDTIGQLVAEMSGIHQRLVILAVTAGEAVDQVMYGYDGLDDKLSAGDIIIDCADSYFKHSQRRADQMSRKGVFFLDAGVSSGPDGARTGAAITVGGDRGAFEFAEPIVKALAANSGYTYCGAAGSGHFVKMVHNGIEYGMMQTIAEGMNILKTSSFSPDLTQLLEVWNNGSALQSKLLESVLRSLKADPELQNTVPQQAGLETGSWSVWQALEQGVSANTIASAVFLRNQSPTADSFLQKVLQAMRSQFGGGA